MFNSVRYLGSEIATQSAANTTQRFSTAQHGGYTEFYYKVTDIFWFFFKKSHNLLWKKVKKRTKFQAEPGLHGLSFRQKWREYAQNMLLLSACFPATDAKLTEKSTCMRFFGEKAEGRKFLLIFLIKILINISKLCNG